jgi:transposase
MVHATLTDQDYSVSKISKLLGVSRVTVIQMVDDTEAEDWIITRPGARKTRLCRGKQILLDMAEDWFDIYRKTSEETGHLTALRLLDNLEKVIDLEENSSRSNSL